MQVSPQAPRKRDGTGSDRPVDRWVLRSLLGPAQAQGLLHLDQTLRTPGFRKITHRYMLYAFGLLTNHHISMCQMSTRPPVYYAPGIGTQL